MRRKGGDRCILPNCLRGYRNCETVRLFNFPLDEARRQEWVAQCHLNKYDVNFQTARICDRHFVSKHMGKKFLKRGALPTLNLPESNGGDVIKFQSAETNRLWQAMNPPPGEPLSPHDEILIVDDLEIVPVQKPTKKKSQPPHYCNGKVHDKGSVPCHVHVDDPPPVCSTCIKFYQVIKESEKQLERKNEELETFRAKYKAILQKYKLVNLQIGKEKRSRRNTLVPSRRRKMHQILDNAKHLNANTKSLCAMLMKTSNTWRTDEKNIAQSIYNNSPISYMHMRDDLNLHLPSRRCIERWNMQTNCRIDKRSREEYSEEDEELDEDVDQEVEEEVDEEVDEAEPEEGEEEVPPDSYKVEPVEVTESDPDIYNYAIEVDPEKIEYDEEYINYDVDYEVLENEIVEMNPDDVTEIVEIDPSKVEYEDANLVEVDPELVEMEVVLLSEIEQM